MIRKFAKSEGSSDQGTIIALPLARDRRLVAKLASNFLSIPPGPKRIGAFERRYLNRLKAQRLALGLSDVAVHAELVDLSCAVAAKLGTMVEPRREERQA